MAFSNKYRRQVQTGIYLSGNAVYQPEGVTLPRGQGVRAVAGRDALQRGTQFTGSDPQGPLSAIFSFPIEASLTSALGSRLV